LAPYYKELALDPAATPAGPARRPFSAESADVLSHFKPPVVSFHFGLPSPELLDQVRSWGAKVLSSATTVAEARWLEAHGVDLIIAQGYEAGGHRGTFLDGSVSEQMGTFALLPQIVNAVRVPVVAAGGIVDAATVSSAFSLGAAGVQAGTAYLLCPEATTSRVHRAALKEERAERTQLTNLFSGRVARGIPNRLMREVGPINRAAPAFPLASAALAPLRAAAERAGSDDFSPLWAGQNTTRCTELPAARITRDLAG
jgi:nitronate monooxygenase